MTRGWCCAGAAKRRPFLNPREKVPQALAQTDVRVLIVSMRSPRVWLWLLLAAVPTLDAWRQPVQGRKAAVRKPVPHRKLSKASRPPAFSDLRGKLGLHKRLDVQEVWDNVRENFRPGQVAAGFSLAVLLALSSATAAIHDFVTDPSLVRGVDLGIILENVRDDYIQEGADLDTLFSAGMNSMLSLLDPYSTFEGKSGTEDVAVRTTGRYGGVGLTIGKAKDDDDAVLVLGALEGYAFDAGVRPGDRILAIDGRPLKNIPTVDETKDLLRGEPGTAVRLTLQRDGDPRTDAARGTAAGGSAKGGGTMDVTVARKLVRLPDVALTSLFDGGVGYIKLEGFSSGTAQEVQNSITRLQGGMGPRPGGPRLKALVLDLRDNPGGLLEAAVAVSQQLVPQGTEIVSTSGRAYGDGNALTYKSSKPPLLDPATRLVVLVNRNTASAAEVVTGVVQVPSLYLPCTFPVPSLPRW